MRRGGGKEGGGEKGGGEEGEEGRRGGGRRGGGRRGRGDEGKAGGTRKVVELDISVAMAHCRGTPSSRAASSESCVCLTFSSSSCFRYR